MDWMDAIANMSNTTSTREFTDNDLIIDMSDFYEDWKPGCATCKDVEKFFDYFCSIVTVLDKDEIRKVFESSFNTVFNVERNMLALIKGNMNAFRNYDAVFITNKKWTNNIFFSARIFHNVKLSEICDFRDEIGERFTHINHDVVLGKDNNNYLIKNNKKRLFGDVFLLFDTIEDFENLPVYPRGLKYEAPIELNNAILIEQIMCNEINSVISIEGSVTVSSRNVPIVTLKDCKILTIKGKGELELINTESMQPCIGCETYTGMSYGRWSPGIRPNCEKIVIDGVNVICKSLVENFSIGQYGTNYCPVIECINGGSINCPEVKGERYIEYQATPPSGSTKISECMKYGLRS